MPDETETTEEVTTEVPADVQAQAEVLAEAEEPAEEPKEEQKPGWDFKRQAADEKRADQKIIQEAAHDKGRLEAELASAQALLATSQKPEDGEPDYDKYEDLVSVVKTLKGQVGDSATQVAEALDRADKAEKAAEELRQNQDLQRRVTEGTAELNKILNKMDGKYGAKYRNEAYANLCKDYDAMKIATATPEVQRSWIETRAQNEYVQARAREVNKPVSEGDPKPDVTLDTGSGGQTPSDDIKEAGPGRSVAQVRQEIDARNARQAR